MKYLFQITVLLSAIMLLNSCGLINSEKNEEEPLYEWEQLKGLSGDKITAIATLGESELYVAQSNRLVYSDDAGKTFRRLNLPDSADVTKIKIFDRLYIIGEVYNEHTSTFGSKQAYVYASNNNGQNWEEITGGYVMQDFTVLDGKLHIGRKHGVTTFDLNADSTLYRNSFINSRLSDHIEEITASQDGSIYLASHDGIHGSFDEGENWERVSTTIGKDYDFIKSITVDDENNMIYAAEYERLYYREKDAVTWEKKNISSGTERVRLLSNNNILTADWDGVYFLSSNNLLFQFIGPEYEETEYDYLSFEYLEVFTDDKIVVAGDDHIFIGTANKTD